MSLLKMSEDEHVLLAAAHHMIYDGWSLGIMARELAALYPAYRAGRPSPLPELPIQYADFAAWQRQLLARRDAGTAAGVLGRAIGRRAALGIAHRLSAAGSPHHAGRYAALQSFAGTERGGARILSPRRGDALHGAAGGVSGAPATLHRPGRFRHRLAGGQSHASGDRGADRLLYQRGRVAERFVG